MTTLHILDHPDRFDICIMTCQSEDIVVLIGSAVQRHKDVKLTGVNHRILSTDLNARGMLSLVDPDIVITPEQVADFCVSYSRQVKW